MANVPGDHRGMFADFNTSALFGAETSTLAANAPRRIASTNPNHVRTHIEAQHECLDEHNCLHRILHLQPNQMEELAESLDHMRTRACLCAESKVPQYPDVPHSPATVEAHNYFGLLRLLLHQHKNNIELNNHLRESTINQHEDFQFPQTAEECKTRHDTTLKLLQQLEQSEQKNATHHDRNPAARAEACANQNDVSAEKYLKRPKHA
jgi:hypothetical protein